jgi:hypothetical protein
MILVLLLWSLILFIFYVAGFSIVILINKITRQFEVNKTVAFDVSFFMGFLTISAVAGLLSIFIPIGNYVLFSVGLIAVSLFLINFREIKINIKEVKKNIALLSKPELLILTFFIVFILTLVVRKITLGDTESYHAQSIQWIRKYAVVPGLGNIHGRLAFNSMFFVISGLLTFQIKEVLIFPLNGISYVVLIVKLLTLFRKEYFPGTRWKSAFYSLALLISLFVFIGDINSPSPDLICTILIIYAFSIIMHTSEKGSRLSLIQIILLNLVVFSCVTFKISSLLLITLILFLLNKEVTKRILIASCIGILVLSSFLIRNYYLSGYLIYPFSAVDLFNVDWKIPSGDVISMKLEIESWAKISTLSSLDVANMKFSEWIMPWFSSLDIISRVLITINLFSLITLVIMVVKKDFFIAKVQLVILLNLVFWFFMAPDPRFAYGFIFLGASLTVCYLFKLIEYSSYKGILNYLKSALICLLALIVFKRIQFPVEVIKNPSLWVISAPFGTVPTRDCYSDFKYRVPVPEGGCFNVEIPCVPFPLASIVMRGKDLQNGFKVDKQKP